LCFEHPSGRRKAASSAETSVFFILKYLIQYYYPVAGLHSVVFTKKKGDFPVGG